jgi:adenosine deaminase/aminodeoxyfutalosine deaminase
VHAIDDLGVSAKGFPGSIEGAFGVEVEIEIGNYGTETIGVVEDLILAMDGLDGELVMAGFAWQFGDEKTVRVDAPHFDYLVGKLEGGGSGVGEEGADGPSICRFVGTEDMERVGVVAADDGVDLGDELGWEHPAIMATVIQADTELHVHLEGSMEPELLCRLDSTLSLEEARGLYRFDSFAGFLQAFKEAVRRLQTPEHYAVAASSLFTSLAEQGVRYAEVIFSAGVVEWKGQSLDAVWEALREAASQAPLTVRWNVDVVRQFGGEPAERVAEWAARHVSEGIVSFGIGGDETARPGLDFGRAVAIAREAGLKFTPHAGETSTAENVWEMVRMGADRIGHGIRAVGDAELLGVLRERGIALEVCPTSNLRTGAVASLALHPLRALFDAGVLVTLNSDDPAIFGSSLAGEFAVARGMGFTDAELAVMAENARRCAFGV